MTDMGMDLMQVKDFLDDKCIHEENPELLLDWIDRPNYINALKSNFVPPVNPAAAMGGGYGYMPNSGMQPQSQPQGMQPQDMGNQQLIQPNTGYNQGYSQGWNGQIPQGQQPVMKNYGRQ